MNGRLRGDVSLNVSISDEDTSQEWQDRLADPSPDSETLLADADDYERRRAALSEALKLLSARERAILEARMLTDEPKTLDDLAQEYRVSRERIRQIEQRAFERLKAAARAKVDNSLPAATRKRDHRDAKPGSASQRALENSRG